MLQSQQTRSYLTLGKSHASPWDPLSHHLRFRPSRTSYCSEHTWPLWDPVSLAWFVFSYFSSSSSNISLCWLPQDPLEFSAQLQCLPYLLKMYVHELASPTKHRDSRTVISLFHFCILCLALYLKHKFSWNVCWINEFALIMLPFLQIQNGEVRLSCPQGFSQPCYAMVLQSCLKSHRDKSPRSYRPKQTQMLIEYKLFNL